ncbi:alanine--tRNA ligase [Promethearchaeum syntrophicum]|uniref:Alanine--tRNA ligase n=1 Tax=Promethearchaeum syntrophicum TaxID=2594042 RepID=A0A5B9DA81_9ARCH|nr:alanine--tRNA ligase [Candidatus Prometheoarchaeum syntrophicum]QEE15660.1 Alanine--tRNA ligase [Candidatus Prometheoarchaeum syntrophicum]
MALLSDKAQKKQFIKIASADPERYYPTNALKKNGFTRFQCEKCGRYYWSSTESNVCGEPGCNKGFQVVDNNPSKNSLSFIDVWKKIVEILEPRGYKPLNRYPVVARWNPTTEFTMASIAAFQPFVISGEVPPPAKKLVIPQFCLRFGDVENVGITGSHCTGFVMIGQHQFVSQDEWDIEQAFQDIFDFLVVGVGLEKHEFKIQEDVWAGGGNYGSCLEFFSRGVELFNQVYMLYQQTPEGPVELQLKVLDMGMGQERIAWFSQGTPTIYDAIFPFVLSKIRKRTKIELDLELFNKFSQFSAFLNNDEVESMEIAWERVGKEMNMDPKILKEKIIPMTAVYSVAEHSRALLFAISDGKLPSNVGGGYNLRVIFRRAMGFIDRFNWDLNMEEVCRWHAEELFEIFPEVSDNLDDVCRILEIEKQKYMATKENAGKIVKKLIQKSEISEEKLLELYDSNGINPEIIISAARKLGKEIKMPDDFYGKVMARHEKITQVHATHKLIEIDIKGLPPTKSLYYSNYLDVENTSKVLKIQKVTYNNNTNNSMKEEEGSSDKGKNLNQNSWGVILESSVAYPTSGGQLNDTGKINDIPFLDVIKVGPCIVHMLSKKPSFNEGDTVSVKINKKRRKLLAQHHSATHIVNAAARKILGDHINQAGAKKTPSKAHLDITHYESLTDDQVDQIEKEANKIVSKKIQSKNRFMSRAEAEKMYGIRLYQGGAIPGKSIRVVETPDVEVEACGGTHVNNTSEIGKIKILKSQKIQDGIVRLTYTAGAATTKILKEHKQITENLCELLDTQPDFLLERAKELLTKWRELTKAKSTGIFSKQMIELTSETRSTKKPLKELTRYFETTEELLFPKLQKLKDEWSEMKNEIFEISKVVGQKNIETLIKNAEIVDNYKFIAAFYPKISNKILVNLSKSILKRELKAIILFVGSTNGGINFISMRGQNLKEINLSSITKKFLNKFKGKGGGKQESTQGFINTFEGNPQDLLVSFKKLLFGEK